MYHKIKLLKPKGVRFGSHMWMIHSKHYPKYLLAVYCILLFISVFTPRSVRGRKHLPPVNSDSNGIITVKDNFLYLRGLPSELGNLFLMVPMSLLLYLSFREIGVRLNIIVCLCTSLLIEFIQKFIPGRVSDFWDVIFNLAGAVTFILVWNLYSKSRGSS